jgi:hypothetical protein
LRLAEQLLLRNIEQLDSGRQSAAGHCEYLEYSTLVKRGYEIAAIGANCLSAIYGVSHRSHSSSSVLARNLVDFPDRFENDRIDLVMPDF